MKQRMHRRLALIIGGAAYLGSVVAAGPANLSTLSPAKNCYNRSFDLKSPNSEHWIIAHESDAAFVFTRNWPSESDSDVALVQLFELPPQLNDAQFESLVRKSIQADENPTRFDIQKSDINATRERKFPCLRYQATSIDHGAPTIFRRKRSLLFQLQAIYCRYPGNPGRGFTVSFSHRGETELPTFNVEAQSFIEHVRVAKVLTPPPADPTRDMPVPPEDVDPMPE